MMSNATSSKPPMSVTAKQIESLKNDYKAGVKIDTFKIHDINDRDDS